MSVTIPFKSNHFSIIATDHLISGYDNLTKIDPLVRLVVVIFYNRKCNSQRGAPQNHDVYI